MSDKNQKPPPKVPHLDLPAKFDEFVKELFERWPSLMDNAVRIAAWAEWELNLGPLHPFYDGCGRISRAFAALLLIRANWKLPVYSSWDEYCCAGQEGVEAFIEYVWERLRWGTVDNY